MLVIPEVQFIEKKGKKVYAVIPYDDYRKLVDEDDPGTPHEVVLLMTENNWSSLKAWRKYLGKTQKEVAKAAGITQAALSQIEKTQNPHSATLEKLAKAMELHVSQLEDI